MQDFMRFLLFLTSKQHLNDIFCCLTMLKQDFFAKTILQQGKVIKLCLESFCSGNRVHFQLEWRKSKQRGTRFERSRKKCLCLA